MEIKNEPGQIMVEKQDASTVFADLFSLNVNDKVEKKTSGKQTLTYLSWTYAVEIITKKYPDFSYEIERFGPNQLPYVYDENTGYMVFTKVTIAGITKEMWLPVMDGNNNAMLNHKYSYLVKDYKNPANKVEKFVEAATMFDVNKTIMRCLVKNLGMFGLGLYIYSGEDLPTNEDEGKSVVGQTAVQKPQPQQPQAPSQITTSQIQRIAELMKEKNISGEELKATFGSLKGKTVAEAYKVIEWLEKKGN